MAKRDNQMYLECFVAELIILKLNWDVRVHCMVIQLAVGLIWCYVGHWMVGQMQIILGMYLVQTGHKFGHDLLQMDKYRYTERI